MIKSTGNGILSFVDFADQLNEYNDKIYLLLATLVE